MIIGNLKVALVISALVSSIVSIIVSGTALYVNHRQSKAEFAHRVEQARAQNEQEEKVAAIWFCSPYRRWEVSQTDRVEWFDNYCKRWGY